MLILPRVAGSEKKYLNDVFLTIKHFIYLCLMTFLCTETARLFFQS